MTGHSGFYRDSHSKGIVNSNEELYLEHKKTKNTQKELLRKEKENVDKINNLEKRVQELEDLIRKHVNGNN